MQCGTEGFVCQFGFADDFFTASDARGSEKLRGAAYESGRNRCGQATGTPLLEWSLLVAKQLTLCLLLMSWGGGAAVPQTAKTTPKAAPKKTTTAPESKPKQSAPAKTPATSKSKTTAAKTPTASKSKTAARKRKKAPPRPRTQQQPAPDRYSEIQQALIDKSYLEGPPTGVWDKKSLEAMQRFQTDQKLRATGKLDALSLIRLGLGPKRQALPPDGIATPPEAPKQP